MPTVSKSVLASDSAPVLSIAPVDCGLEPSLSPAAGSKSPSTCAGSAPAAIASIRAVISSETFIELPSGATCSKLSCEVSDTSVIINSPGAGNWSGFNVLISPSIPITTILLASEPKAARSINHLTRLSSRQKFVTPTNTTIV
ncbi:hypothetical protein Vca1114GL_00352 [Vibrio campbellii]|nr:hypothetical protein Vca1114GL_00352 [Vibrio campbellii]